MCGIIGYIGAKPVVPVLLDGLRRMEYRGYDSAGVALVSPEGISLRRSAGKLSNLETSIRSEPIDGLYGVGHTRWATHGRPSEENAHPHRDCTGRIVVVHNGIIENYLDLKKELRATGHEFKTETDTEIVAHLVEREMKDDGLENAVRRALVYMRGMFAIVLVSVDDPEKIVAVRNGAPVVIGLGENEFFVASDVTAILSHTRDVVFLGDEEMAVITRTGVQVHRLFRARSIGDDQAGDVGPDRGGEGRPQALHAQGDSRAADGGARHHPRSRLARQRPDLPRGPEHLRRRPCARSTRSPLLACGTSWHAALVGKYLIEALGAGAGRGRLRLRVPLPQSDRRQPRAGDHHHAVGRDGRHARGPGRGATRKGPAASPSATWSAARPRAKADGTVYTHAGPEIGVASTKAFTSQLVALQLLALHMAQVRGTLSPADMRRHIEELLQLPNSIEQAIKASAPMEKVAERFYNRQDFLFLGRGINYPIALEGALKLKEISYIHAEGYPAGEMKHGPIALIDENMPVVAIAPDDHVFEKMASNVQEVKARGGSVIAIVTSGDPRMATDLDPAHDVIVAMPRTAPLLTPIVMTIPLQLLAYHIAVRRGCDVDQPRNLAKSVTVE